MASEPSAGSNRSVFFGEYIELLRHIYVMSLGHIGRRETMNTATISAQQLHDLVQQGQSVELIDVRTPVEFREVHVILERLKLLTRQSLIPVCL